MSKRQDLQRAKLKGSYFRHMGADGRRRSGLGPAIPLVPVKPNRKDVRARVWVRAVARGCRFLDWNVPLRLGVLESKK